jgi:hypothetical protein
MGNGEKKKPADNCQLSTASCLLKNNRLYPGSSILIADLINDLK